MQHVEFFHIDHFENNYYRTPPSPGLANFIDFFWETKFDGLWSQYPHGFSDVQFANIGYTYIINLGTEFVMQVDRRKFKMKTDGFLPRYNAIECFHKPGNHLFGIKFRISPVIFEKRVNFSEYKGYVYPLSYLLEQSVIDKVKWADSFDERVGILKKHFTRVLASHEGSLQAVDIVSSVLDRCFQENDFSILVAALAKRFHISERTLQRYFESCTGISSKQALQVMRIRKAVSHLVNSPADFDHTLYGYYDLSHFYKHARQFLGRNTLKSCQLPMKWLLALEK